MRYIQLIAILVLALCARAQQPSYAIHGSEEFAGIDIYSLLQDREANIWIATENGLFKYDGYTYTKYLNVSMKTKDLFALRMDNKGSVFCTNLYGQIFNMQNDSLVLYHQIAENRLSAVLEYDFDNLNQVVYCTDGYYVLTKDKKARLILPYAGYSQSVSKSAEGEILIVDIKNHQIRFFKDNKLTSKIIKLNGAIKRDYSYHLQPYTQDQRLMLYAQGTTSIYDKRDEEWREIALANKSLTKETYRFYHEKNGNRWFADFRKGIFAFDIDGNQLYGSSILFPNYSISGMLEDREGNLWFATLGKGLIVIPNKNFIDFTDHPTLRDDDIKSLTADESGTLFFSGLRGKIYKIYNNEVSLFYDNDQLSEFIKYLPNTHQLFAPNHTIDIRNRVVRRLDLNSIKDISRFTNEIYICAANVGIQYFSLNDISKEEQKLLYNLRDHTHKSGRVWCIEYDSTYGTFWYQSTTGVKVFKDNQTHSILHLGKNLLANDLEQYKDKIWVATEKGVLVYQNEKLIQNLTTESGLLSNEITKIKARKNRLYIVSIKGIQEYNPANRTFRSITKEDGLLSDYILDFEVINNDIWIAFAAGLQKVQFDKIDKAKTRPIISFNAINAGTQNVLNVPNAKLSYRDNEVEFEFAGKYFQNAEQLHYEYQLLGQDTAWKSVGHSQNKLKFLSLSSGQYTFSVRAVTKYASSDVISYSFEILSPFWQTWWFVCVVLILLAALAFGIFSFRIRNVKKQLDLEQQLKLSEITALKAQMNPHFVFNCLNSIQALVLQKEVNTAYDYISKFAQLVRSIMHQSGLDIIDFEEEVNTLTIYLELEKLRFKKDFKYTLDTNEITDIEIPPMLIQPFIENALKHGLLHKVGEKSLSIVFSLENEILVCTITDNGIGREQSEVIKKRQSKAHKSFATKTTDTRLVLLQKQYGKENLGATYADLSDESGNATGTTVILRIPCVINY